MYPSLQTSAAVVGGVQSRVQIMVSHAIKRRGGAAAWQGSVEVVGFIHYHNTITIPNDENWIVHGTVDPASGLPASLDGRLKSGSAFDRSHANIVLRHLRISNQMAPIDGPDMGGIGGAFQYEGGSNCRHNDQTDLVKIAFSDVVFDHNTAARCVSPRRFAPFGRF